MTKLTDTSLDGNGNLLAHYEFDSGALVTDSSGNSRTLTNNNTVGETASGKYGYGADFGDPNTDKDFSRAEDIWANGAASFVCWAKRTNITDTMGFMLLNDAATMKQLYLYVTSANLAAAIYRVGEGYDTVTTATPPDTKWHHYALTLTTGAGGTMLTYLDGVQLGTKVVTNSSGSVGQADQYKVGIDAGNRMEGLMDDVAFFNDVLTPAEIKELAYVPIGGNPMFFSSGGLAVS